jgi:hypothetical protein
VSSTQSAPDASTLRPWQFFTLIALFSATVAVFMVRGTSPANIILLCLAIGAAALVGLGALRTLRPLVAIDAFEPEMAGTRTRAALEREKNLILRSIKELEFDHAMGKVSTPDFDDMTARLRARAVRLLKQLDSADSGYREIIEKELASRLVKSGAVGAAKGAPYEDTGTQHDAAPDDETVAAPLTTAAAGRDVSRAGFCSACGAARDSDARFCKHCGAKLLLAVFAVLAFAGSGWAQGGFQMPDPKQMSGIPRPVTDLPEGHISVRLIRGQLSNNIPNAPVELHAGSKVITVKTDENGRAEFSGVAGGTAVKAVAVVDGERLESEEFPAPSQGGIRLMLVATPKPGDVPPAPTQAISGTVVLGDQSRIVLDFESDALNVYYLLDIQNSARAPVNPPSPLIFDMPADAQGTAILGGAPQAIAAGNRVTVKGPFAPGATSVQISYQMPYSGGDLTVLQKLPVGAGNMAVLMKKVGDMSLSSPQLGEQQERDFQGERYVLAQGPPQAAGSTLALNLSGLPHHSPVPRILALGLACGIVLAGLWFARGPRQGTDPARLKQLKGKRERLFTELVRLEHQRQTGSLDNARYAERRPALIAQLERVYRDLDTEGGQGLAA